MIKLTERKRIILLMVVREYIDTGQPVSSNHLVDNCMLDLSPATIRTELSALTEMGLLRQPHTSAGRVPTEEGYRLFINEVIPISDLADPDKMAIRDQFDSSRADVGDWMQTAARVLARKSSAVSVITAPRAIQNKYKHIELLSISGRQIFTVLVLIGGEVVQRYVSLSEPVSQDRLSEAAKNLNRVCAGKTLENLSTTDLSFGSLEEDILAVIKAEIRRIDTDGVGKLYYDGLANLRAVPEVSDTNALYRAIDMLDEGSSLGKIMGTLSDGLQPAGTVQVLIGVEDAAYPMKDFSMVYSNYGIPGKFSGALGVLGPMRMPYNRAIPTVRFIANVLSDFLVNNYIE